ncbi:alpha/beta-hydrolase [Apiospora phragmitis]|uniref:Alpha/beta-hydrolase n=1 Tax=Apiospora phragmitis TaxID=2905665 RepID=A0ABR1W858_9PEZI
MATSEITEFDPTIPKEEVDRLWRKLRDTRLPETPVVPGAGDDYGPPLDWVHKLFAAWRDDFDWPAAQRRIDRWKHYTTVIEDLRIHFVHQPAKQHQRTASSAALTPIPLLLVHGWPGSWYEFSRVIDPLSNPGSEETQAFHVVAASLPGFTWSAGPPRGWTLQDTARVFDALMKRLGYARYAVQGGDWGDWGHWVVRELAGGNAASYQDSCKAAHTNMCPSMPPVPKEEQGERERVAQRMTDWWMGTPGNEGHMGYAVEMRTRPQTIGIALSDSPLGILAWVGEKYYELVDPKYHSLDENDNNDFVDDVCTTLCLYFFTPPSIMTSALCYTNNVRHEDYVAFNARPENAIRAPFGVSSFRYDVAPVSRRAAATTGNCRWFREHEGGGHFAALEEPSKLVQDLRECFTAIWPMQ